MNTKGIKFLAVLAVLAMAFAAFAVVSDTEQNDATVIAPVPIGTGSGLEIAVSQSKAEATVISTTADGVIIKGTVAPVDGEYSAHAGDFEKFHAMATITGLTDGVSYTIKQTNTALAYFVDEENVSASGNTYVKVKTYADTDGTYEFLLPIDGSTVTIEITSTSSTAKGVGVYKIDCSKLTTEVNLTGAPNMSIPGITYTAGTTNVLNLNGFTGNLGFYYNDAAALNVTFTGSNTINLCGPSYNRTANNEGACLINDVNSTSVLTVKATASSAKLNIVVDGQHIKDGVKSAWGIQGNTTTIGDAEIKTVIEIGGNPNRAIRASGALTITNADLSVTGSEYAIRASSTVTIDGNSTVSAGLYNYDANGLGEDEHWGVKADGALSVALGSTLNTQGMKLPTLNVASDIKGIVNVQGDFIQEGVATSYGINGLFVTAPAVGKATAKSTLGTTAGLYIIDGAKAYNIEVVDSSDEPTQETIPAASQATIEAALDKDTVTDVTAVVTTAITNLDLELAPTQSLTFVATAALTGTIAFKDDTSNYVQLNALKGTFTITKGSIYIDGVLQGGTIELPAGADVKMTGSVDTADTTIKMIDNTKTATVTILAGETVTVNGFALKLEKGVTLDVYGKLTKKSGSTVDSVNLASGAKLNVYDGGELSVSKFDGAGAYVAKAGSKVANKYDGSGSLTVYSGSDANSLDSASKWAKITGKDSESGKWTYDATILTLDNYNGTYNFEPIANVMTKINLVGSNTVSYTAAAGDAGKTLFGGAADKLANITTIQGSASLIITADLSAVTSFDAPFYVIDAKTLEIDAVSLGISVYGTGDWDEIIEDAAFFGIGDSEGLEYTDLTVYNAGLEINVMSAYDAKNGYGVEASKVDISSCMPILIGSSGTGLKSTGNVTVRNTVVGLAGQSYSIEVGGKLTISNYAEVNAEYGAVLANTEISQESTLSVNNLDLKGALANDGIVNITGVGMIESTGSITNRATMNVAGTLGAYGTIENAIGGTFQNDGAITTFAIGNVGLEEADSHDATITYKNEAATDDEHAIVQTIVFDDAVFEINSDGTISVNDATLTFRNATGALGALVDVEFSGILTPSQAVKGNYALTLANDTASVTVTYDKNATTKYTIAVYGNVTDGVNDYALEANTTVAPKADTLDDLLADVTSASGADFEVSGGTFTNGGAVVLFAGKTPVTDASTIFNGNLITYEDVSIAGKVSGDLIAYGDVDFKGTFTGDVASYGDVKISNGTTSPYKVIGDITTSGNVEVAGALAGDLIFNDSEGGQTLTVSGAVAGEIFYKTKYKGSATSTSADTEFTASMTAAIVMDSAESLVITMTKGNDYSTTAAASGGFFTFTTWGLTGDEGLAIMSLKEGKIVTGSATLPVSYILTVEKDTTFQVNKSTTLTIAGALRVSDEAIANFETAAVPSTYGKIVFPMSFTISEGYTVYSSVEYALSSCDEGSEMTVGQNATMTDSVSIKAGVNVIVNSVTLDFANYGLEMAEGAKITLVGTGKVIFGVTTDDGEDEPELYYVSGTFVYDDNTIVLDDVRFVNDEILSSTIVGTAATSTADSKLTVALDYDCGVITLATGMAAGTIDLDVDVTDVENVTFASYIVAEGAISEAFITDAYAEYGDDLEEVCSVVDVDGTMMVSKALTINGSYLGPGSLILADGVTVDVKGTASTLLISITNGVDGIIATTTDSLFNVKSVAATTTVPAYVLFSDAVLTNALIVTEGNVVADNVNLKAEFDEDDEEDNYVATLMVPEDSALTILKDGVAVVLDAEGLLLVKGTLNYYTEDTKSYGVIGYEVTFDADGYTAYTILDTATRVAPAGTTISIDESITYDGDFAEYLVIPSGISVEVAVGQAIVLQNGAYIILGDADESNVLGAGGCLTGAIILKDDKSYVIDFPSSGSFIAVYTNDTMTTLASEGIFLVQDTVYATVYGKDTLTLGTGVILKTLVPVIPGYYFNAWYLQNGDKVEVGTEITEGPFVANAVASKVTVVFATVAGIDYYVDGIIVNTLDAPVKVMYGSTVTAKISDTSKYQGTPLVNGKAYILIDDEVSKVTGSGVNPIPVPPEPEPEPEVDGLKLTDILLIVLVVLIAIMVVILVLRLNRS